MISAPEAGDILTGPLFSEPVRVITARAREDGVAELGVVGTRSQQFRVVSLNAAELAKLAVTRPQSRYDGDPKLLRLALQAYALGIAYEFDPYFALSVSRVDPLPHQLSAVYDYLLKLPRVRFLLADDAGAGKTIMAGLLIRELKLRGLAERVIIVVPANLAFQWQRELKEKFGEQFKVLKGAELRDQFGVNQWVEEKQVITSLDLAKRDEILRGLEQAHWDLAIVDEAHHMSWTPPSGMTERYRLGALLRDTSDHLLLLTATPHKGNPEHFSRFLQLLDPDAFADVKSIEAAMGEGRAPFYLRRTKEAMVYFPERQADGSWDARKIFTKRIPHTVDFQIDGEEHELYRAVTGFVQRQSARAAANEEDPRARAVGFLMALYQRRLASSTFSLRRSLENRAKRLEEALTDAQKSAGQIPTDLPTPEELEEMEDEARERFERLIEIATISRNAGEIRQEIAELKELALQAKAVEDAGVEAKLSRLEEMLRTEGFFDRPEQRLLIFTEFKDTLDYLVSRFTAWGFRVGFIHGSMKPGSRDEPYTRLFAEQQFKDGAIQVLVATEAAGEGINLQCCHILFNYDIPWNPNRLEQRMGRIHRYGQTKDCLIFNFVATNTIEGRVLGKLLEKLQEIRNALNDDAVFNVVGEVLPAAHVERVLRDYYAGRLGAEDLEERMLHDVDERQFRDICQNALEGLASKALNLSMLVERKARAQERRVVPESIARFIREGGEYVDLSVRALPAFAHGFEIGKIPSALRQFERAPDWRLPPLALKYGKCTTDRTVAELNNLEWVTPGHPLFEALRRQILVKGQGAFAAGACFYSLAHDKPARLEFFRARVVDGLDRTVKENLFVVELADGQQPKLREPAILGDLMPGKLEQGTQLPADDPAEVRSWLEANALRPFLGEVQAERVAEVDRVARHVELSLTELLAKADLEIGRAAAEVERGAGGAEGRLAYAESKHQELTDRRERRRRELERQRSLTLQAVERLASVIVLPHPEREAPEVRRLRPDSEVEWAAMNAVMAYERSEGRQVFDVHEKNLGYDLTSLDLTSGELRLIEVKGIGAVSGTVLLTPNERRVAEDRRDCSWLYVVTECKSTPTLQEPIRDPARFPWHEVTKVEHYWLDINAMTRPMRVSETPASYGTEPPSGS